MDVTTWLLTALVTLIIGETKTHEHAHAHAHGNAEDRPTGFHDPKVVHDTEHIKEHYEGQAKLDEAEMTPEELEFHYFKLHDYDNNTKLDGLEILKALTHLVPYEPEDKARGDQGTSAEEKMKKQKEEELNYYMDIVDTVLEEDDIDNDGYLTYAEYVLARKREEAKRDDEQKQATERKHPQQNPKH